MAYSSPLSQLTSCFKPSKKSSKPWAMKDADEESDDVPATLKDPSEIPERPQWKDLTPPSPHHTSRSSSAVSTRTKPGAKRTVKIPTHAPSAPNRPLSARNERSNVQATTTTSTLQTPHQTTHSQVNLPIQMSKDPQGQKAHPMSTNRPSPPHHEHRQTRSSDRRPDQPCLPEQKARKPRSSDVGSTIGVPYENHTTGVGPRRAPPSRVLP